MKRAAGPRAYTLLELVLVVVIIAMAATMAAPRIHRSIQRQRIEAAANRVAADLRMARRRAMAQSASVAIEFDVTKGESAYQVNMPHPDHPDAKYRVILTLEPYLVTISSAVFGADAELIYDGFGVPDSNGQVVLVLGDHRRVITIDASAGEPVISE